MILNTNLDKWVDLSYWQSGEWDVVQEKLQDELKAGRAYCPRRDLLFRSLDLVSPGAVRCVVVGQDPYPNPNHATGIAFSVPGDLGQTLLPPTLKNIFKEYQSDLKYPAPKNGDLTPWCKEGVLLWNAYPSAPVIGSTGNHHWDEWTYLTKEILEKLSGQRKGVVYIFMGRVARDFSKYVTNIFDGPFHLLVNSNPLEIQNYNVVIETSHPSPLGVNHGFKGSQIFTRTNFELKKLGQPTIDWKLQ